MVKCQRVRGFLWVAGVAAVCCSWAQAGDKPGDKFPTYDTPYYTIHSDIDKEKLREIEATLTPLAEEYNRRIKEFSPAKATKKLPFYLFAKNEDYLGAGGPAGSSGVFKPDSVPRSGPVDGRMLVSWDMTSTVVPKEHVIQHECFHQFLCSMVAYRLMLLPWINEGLAEYYGYAAWTGDGYVAGILPPVTLAELQREIKAKEMLPVTKSVPMDFAQWTKACKDTQNHTYVQCWGTVYFLVHADGGKYQKLMNDFIKDVAGGKPQEAAFAARFGPGGGPLGKRYEEWWLAQTADSTADLQTRATVATMTSFLARAHASGMKFKDYDDFLQQADQDKLLNKTSQWLPKELLAKAVDEAKKLEGWSLAATSGRPPKLLLKTSDGTVFTGTFQSTGKRVTKVDVTVTKARTPTSGKSDPAKAGPNAADQLQHIKDRINGYHPGVGD